MKLIKNSIYKIDIFSESVLAGVEVIFLRSRAGGKWSVVRNPDDELLYDVKTHDIKPRMSRLESQLKKESNMDSRIQEWSFTVGSLTQIDPQSIMKELSYANPLALIKINGKHLVVLHDSLLKKMLTCEDGVDMLRELDTLLNDTGIEDLYGIDNMTVVGKLQKLFANAKEAPFLEEHKFSGKVTVQIINI